MSQHSFKRKPGVGKGHLQHAPSDAQPGRGEPGTLVSANTPQVEPGYHSLSPVVLLIGHGNEATAVVEGVEVMALLDTGSQISALTNWMCTEFGLRIFHWEVCCILKGQGVFQHHTRDTWRLTQLYQVYSGILRMCYF